MSLYSSWSSDLHATPQGRLGNKVAKIAEAYDESLLMLDSVPREAFEFLLFVFSDTRILASRGLERFLLDANVDLHKYSPTQTEELLKVLLKNAQLASDSLVRHSIGDFIARAYSPATALAAHDALSGGTEREKDVAFVLLDVLRRRVKPEQPEWAKVQRLWEQASRE